MTRALFADALAQVLDNKVFRLLVILVLVMVLPTFVVGLREDSIVILFGVREYFYEDLFAWFGVPFPGLGEAHVQVIQTIQQLFVDYFAGTVGVTFAVATTAFFVPRMLEKGAADTLFSKPISRFTLLLSRYFAGLAFIAILALALVGGMHLGLTLNSGYSDPGFLWSILTLVYLFSVLHAVSILVGVATRSTVVSILATTLFFVLCFGVHVTWQFREENRERIGEMAELRNDAAEGADTFSWLEYVFVTTLEVAHYVLPKTNDATKIAQKLRLELSSEPAPVRDPDSELEVKVPPYGFDVEGDFPEEPIVWTSEEHDVVLRLERRVWDGPETENDTYRWSNWGRFMAARVVEERRAELDADPNVRDLTERRTRRGYWRDGGETFEVTRTEFADQSAAFLDWTAAGPDGDRSRRAIVFARHPEWIYTLEIDIPAGWDDTTENARLIDGFTASFAFYDEDDDDPRDWMAERFDWDAELKYNIFFSIGSTLAFLGLVLALGGWRLSRIDF